MSGPRSILTLFELPPAQPRTPAPAPAPEPPAPAAAPPVPPSPRADEKPRAWNVTDLCRRVRMHLEKWGAVTVVGEVTGFRGPHNGNWYFQLKDAQSVLQCTMFSSDNARVRGFDFRNGLSVEVTGRISFWEARGQMQLLVSSMALAGQGALAAAYEAMRQKLEAEGLFARARKRPIPPLPRAVGVVTSAEGAALHDILTVTRRRAPGIPIIISPTRVQGAGAPVDILRALKRLDASGKVDVIILGRGGGSAEDLAAFNDEALARAVAACRTPVISAVGHETDVSITDWVADMRAATPSAAAELAVPDQAGHLQRLHAYRARLEHGIAGRMGAQEFALLRAQQRLSSITRRLQDGARTLDDLHARLQAAHPAALLRHRREALSAHEDQLVTTMRGLLQDAASTHASLHADLMAHTPHALLARARDALADADARLQRAGQKRRTHARSTLVERAARLQALSPLAVLSRGYGIVTQVDGRVVRAATEAPEGTPLSIRLGTGTLSAVSRGPAPNKE